MIVGISLSMARRYGAQVWTDAGMLQHDPELLALMAQGWRVRVLRVYSYGAVVGYTYFARRNRSARFQTWN